MVYHYKYPLFYLWPLPWGQSHAKCCPVPSTSCHLCTCKVEVAASNGLRDAFTRKYITQNITRYPLYHMTYAPAKFEAATSNSLGGDAFLQEKTLFVIHLEVKVTQNVFLYPPHHVTYAPVKFVVAMSNSFGGYAFTRKYITQNVTQYPPHHVTYAPAKFEVAESNRLGWDAFTRKYIIWPLTLTLRSHEMSPSTLYFMWSMHLQSLKLLRPTV